MNSPPVSVGSLRGTRPRIRAHQLGSAHVSRHNKGKRRRRPKSTAPQVPPRAPRGVERIDARPKAPWHPFPLVELCVLVGIVLIVLGLIVGFDSDRGQLALVCGVLLASLGGLDTAVREHFSGYRSHSSVLAGLPGVVAAAALFFARAPWIAVAAGAALAFGLAFWAFPTAFRRRSGGLSFR
jgi:hypothetical protein